MRGWGSSHHSLGSLCLQGWAPASAHRPPPDPRAAQRRNWSPPVRRGAGLRAAPTCQQGGQVWPVTAGLLIPPGSQGGTRQATGRSYQTLSRQQAQGFHVFSYYCVVIKSIYFFPKGKHTQIHLFSSYDILLCEDTPTGTGGLRPPVVSGWAAGRPPAGRPGRTGPGQCSAYSHSTGQWGFWLETCAQACRFRSQPPRRPGQHPTLHSAWAAPGQAASAPTLLHRTEGL